MPSETNLSFDTYANFKFGDAATETPVLPVKNSPEINSVELSAGSYTTTIDIGDNRVAKVSRMLRINDGKLEMQGENTRNYLVKHTTNAGDGRAKVDRNEVVSRMLQLADDKKRAYETLGKYIGEYMPSVDFFAVVESPRREIENRLQKQLTVAELNAIPTAEISLMEVCEKVDANNGFARKSYSELKEFFESAEAKHELAGFANASLKLMVEERSMLDICDQDGIRGMSKDGRKVNIKGFEELTMLDEQVPTKGFVFPRNTTYQDGKIKFYDVFPFDVLDNAISDEQLQQMCDSLRAKDWEQLKQIVDTGKGSNYRLHTLRYLVLLEKMGADI